MSSADKSVAEIVGEQQAERRGEEYVPPRAVPLADATPQDHYDALRGVVELIDDQKDTDHDD